MALNIKNSEVERLAAEVAEITGESKTEAIKKSLEIRKEQLIPEQDRRARLESFMVWMEREVWSKLSPDVRGRGISQAEQDEILGYGPDGYCI